jgi:pyrimidine operon attenuation protein/uracil phosphoribosyltransferase
VKKLKAKLLNGADFERTLTRMAHEIAERHIDLSRVAVIGIHTRGEYIGRRLVDLIEEQKKYRVPFGLVDVTFYRDDFRTHLPSPEVGASEIPFAVDDLNIILVDDVLYTGRTVRAAMNSVMDYGRPSTIELAVLVDRGQRELPIQADFIGRSHPTSINEHIHVHVQEVDDEDAVLLLEYEQ